MKESTIRLAAVSLIFLASSILAQAPREALTAKQVIELLALHEQLGTTPANTALENQLIWWWAVDRGLNAEETTEQLSTAYRQARGDIPAGFHERLRQTLVDLPNPGSGVYFPPTYIVRARLSPRPLPFMLGPPQLGPNEKSALSLITSGTTIRRRR